MSTQSGARTVFALRAQEIDLPTALTTYADFREADGWGRKGKLTGAPGDNHKTGLNTLPTYNLTLFANYMRICPFSTPQCRATCLVDIGRGGEPRTAQSRRMRTAFLWAHPDAFCTILKAELLAGVRKYGRIGARLNTLSDVPWETVAPWLFEIANVTFYDYTKNWSRRSLPNYSLTFSASERTADFEIVDKVNAGETVAVMFNVNHRPGAKQQSPLPVTYLGLPVIDGDVSDERFNDSAVVIGLRAKGRAKALPVGGFKRDAAQVNADTARANAAIRAVLEN